MAALGPGVGGPSPATSPRAASAPVRCASTKTWPAGALGCGRHAQAWGIPRRTGPGGLVVPPLSEQQRQAYRQPSRREASGYSLADHPQLANPQIRKVFDLLDARIRVLDPNVCQELLKLTIAYEAESNFVDIVPEVKRLRFSLNMPFAEPDDPRGIARNVAGFGRWGHGEVEFGVASSDCPLTRSHITPRSGCG